MSIVAIVCFIIWLYFLSVLKRSKVTFWYFCIGSIGMFIFLMIWIQPIITDPCIQAVTGTMQLIGEMTEWFTANFALGLLFVQSNTESIMLYVTYECSGVVELFVFSSLLWFFPLYRLYEKILLTFVGVLTLFVGNVIRLFLIAGLLHLFGNDMYFMAHTVYGRLVLYAISIILYYTVFTKVQIVRQKVGNFKYATD